MSIYDLYWMRDTWVSTTWNKDKSILSVMVQRNGECKSLVATFDSEQVETYSDDYWQVIWIKLSSLKSLNDWCYYTLSNQIQAKLALASLWDLMRELECDDSTSNDAMEQQPYINAISSRIITLYLNLIGLDLIP